jgi:hypothetical protein
MNTAALAVCAALLGALTGAWITHLAEAEQFHLIESQLKSDRQAQIVELGRRLNLCLVDNVDLHAKLKSPTEDAK